MKVGDYVRTEYGEIGTIIECPKELEKNYGMWLWFDNQYEQRPIRREQIDKSSPRIIDLIEVQDLMLIDISPDDCGGIVVPRIAETQAELDEFINKMQNGEYILKGILTKEQIENQVYWLGLDKEEK